MINFSAGLPWAQQRKSSLQNLRWEEGEERLQKQRGKIAECDLSSVLKILRSEAKNSYERTTITHHYEM